MEDVTGIQGSVPSGTVVGKSTEGVQEVGWFLSECHVWVNPLDPESYQDEPAAGGSRASAEAPPVTSSLITEFDAAQAPKTWPNFCYTRVVDIGVAGGWRLSSCDPDMLAMERGEGDELSRVRFPNAFFWWDGESD